jgi:hypothetical protein
LICCVCTREQNRPHDDFPDDAPDGPNVNFLRILLGTKEQLRSAIESTHNVARVTPRRGCNCSASKINDFHSFCFIDHDIRGLQVAMDDTARMDVGDPAQNLERVISRLSWSEWLRLDDIMQAIWTSIFRYDVLEELKLSDSNLVERRHQSYLTNQEEISLSVLRHEPIHHCKRESMVVRRCGRGFLPLPKRTFDEIWMAPDSC